MCARFPWDFGSGPVPAPNPQNVPEPTTLALALMGLLGFAFHLTRGRHRRRA